MAIVFSGFSFFYLICVSWVYANKKVNKYIFYVLVGLFSGVFSTYFSHDSIAYQKLFLEYSTSPFSNTSNEIIRHELFFVLFSKVLSFLPVAAFFCIYAIVSFAVKLSLIEKVSRDPLLSLLCFFAFFFLYMDGTVVRVSLGIAVAYWGVYLLSQNKVVGFLVVVLLSSILFHYSLIVLLIVPFFRSHLSIVLILLMTLFFLVLYFFGFGVLDFLLFLAGYMDSSYIGVNKFISYLNRSDLSYPFSIIFIGLFLISFISYFFYKNSLSKFEIIAFNMLFLSFLFLVMLYQSQVMQNRISEIFRYSLVFVAPMFYLMLKDFLKRPYFSMTIYCFFLSGYFFYYYYFKKIISNENLGLLNALAFLVRM